MREEGLTEEQVEERAERMYFTLQIHLLIFK